MNTKKNKNKFTLRKDHQERERSQTIEKGLQLSKLQRNCKITASAFILYFFSTAIQLSVSEVF